MISALVASIVALGGPGHSATHNLKGPARPQWLIKGEDLVQNGTSGYLSEGIAAAAKAANVRLPYFKWRLCGVWNGVRYGYSDYTTCTNSANSVLVVESYTRFEAAMEAGFKSRAVLFDLEGWKESDNESEHPVKWIHRVIRLAHKHGISVIVSPGFPLQECRRCWTAASGAYRVSVQSQSLGSPAKWEALVKEAAKIIGKSRVIAGLATNTPSTITAKHLIADVKWALRYGIDQFWINAADWKVRNPCTPADGSYGCPVTAVQLFAYLAKHHL
jgi:hypothetical protein